jgi:hypothetical protein
MRRLYIHRKNGKSSTAAEGSSSQRADPEAGDSENSDERVRLARWVRNMRRTALVDNLGIRFSVTFSIPVNRA